MNTWVQGYPDVGLSREGVLHAVPRTWRVGMAAQKTCYHLFNFGVLTAPLQLSAFHGRTIPLNYLKEKRQYAFYSLFGPHTQTAFNAPGYAQNRNLRQKKASAYPLGELHSMPLRRIKERKVLSSNQRLLR
jgi:hypothetical protein